MNTQRKKRQLSAASSASENIDTSLTTFSSDLLTPEEERELLTNFWDCKQDLVKALIRNFPQLRAHRPPMGEPWPMAQFIREHCEEDGARSVVSVRRLHDRYVHYKHRLASANIRLAAHVAKRFRHHSLSYADLLQEAVCGLMQAIDRFDVSHGTRLATYATWWIRQTLQIAVARQSHLVSLSPHHLQELDLRFGLTGNGTHSLRQIGHLLRISKERVRQIQNRALEKLRSSAERVGWEPNLLLE